MTSHIIVAVGCLMLIGLIGMTAYFGKMQMGHGFEGNFDRQSRGQPRTINDGLGRRDRSVMPMKRKIKQRTLVRLVRYLQVTYWVLRIVLMFILTHFK